MPLWFVIVVCLLPVVLFLKWTRIFREKYPDTFGYVLSLLGTFVGIILGIYFSDMQAIKSKKATTVKVLEAGKEEIEWLIQRSKTINFALDSLSNRQRDKFLHLELPPFYTSTMRTELMAEMLHPLSLEQLNLVRENILFDVELLRKDTKELLKKSIEEDLADYQKQLRYTLAIIDAEIERLGAGTEEATFNRLAKERLQLLMKD
jgi:hypothetical protein